MIQQQVYFVHAHVTERGKPDTAPQRFDRGFLATSKDDAEEQMRDYVTDKLPEGCAWDWEVSLYSRRDEEEARRELLHQRSSFASSEE